MTRRSIPPELAELRVGDLTPEQLDGLLDQAVEGGARLSFAGKQAAGQVRPRVRTTVERHSFGPASDRARNLVVEGDNLEAMATLSRYRGQVDLVLTDPPYNTGRAFRYDDRWAHDPDADGDLAETGQARWLRFMWPRLKLMKAMLKPGGVLAVCIDHRELFRLGQLLDELFGEANRLAIINWQKSYAPRADRSHVSTATEYVLAYANDGARARTRLLPRTAAMDQRYRSPDGDPRVWKGGDLSAGKGKQNQGMMYAIQSPFTGELHYPPPACCWRPAQREVLRLLRLWDVAYQLVPLADDDRRAHLLGVALDELKPARGVLLAEPLETASRKARAVLERGRWPGIFFGQDGQGRPQLKRYLDDVKRGKVPTTWWADEDYQEPTVLDAVSWPHQESGHSQTGAQELDAILGGDHGFATVKPLRLFAKVIQLWCGTEGLVLDPFAGSGTTGHAVQALNAATGATRRFILVEQGRPEKGDPYARTLTAERLRRVATGAWAKGPQEPLGGGFTYQRLGERIDAGALLRMERAELRDTVLLAHDGRPGGGLRAVDQDGGGYRYLVAANADGEGCFLVWDGPDTDADLTSEVYAEVVAEARAAGLKPGRYHVYARRWVHQRPTTSFYQIPDHILASTGPGVRGELSADQDPG